MTDPRDVRIYTASKVKHGAMWRKLRDGGVPINSTWIDEAGVGQSSDLADLASRCIKEARTATAMVLYCEPGELLKGALFEAGAALSAGVPVFCVGTCESLSKTFNRHPMWHTAESVEVAIDAALTPKPDAPPVVKDCPTGAPLADAELETMARAASATVTLWMTTETEYEYAVGDEHRVTEPILAALRDVRDRCQPTTPDDSDRIETLEGALRKVLDRLAAIPLAYQRQQYALVNRLLASTPTLIEEGEKALREEES